MPLLPGVRARTVYTDRLRVHVCEAGPEGGVPVVLLHGKLSTGRFFEHVMAGAPQRYRLLAPDMRGFRRTQPVPIDATRGLRDWADDTHALVRALGIKRPVSAKTGGGFLHSLGHRFGVSDVGHDRLDRAAVFTGSMTGTRCRWRTVAGSGPGSSPSGARSCNASTPARQRSGPRTPGRGPTTSPW
ncbi:MAG TPA: alpha/beta hydrolase [Pseudonocardiaceae bacterium]